MCIEYQSSFTAVRKGADYKRAENESYYEPVHLHLTCLRSTTAEEMVQTWDFYILTAFWCIRRPDAGAALTHKEQ